jgi:DNA-binding transcriptional LysR family regulator
MLKLVDNLIDRCVLFMFIDFKWFEDFLSLAKNNNFSRAAEERHVTQSAFSRRIKALELWIGVPLVDRSTYPTELTDEGKIFTKKAREVVLMMHGIKNEFHEMRVKGEHTLHFTSLHTTALTFFPKWLIDIERDLGALSTRLEADSMHNCVQNMTESGHDFLIASTHPSVPVLLDPQDYPFLVIGHDRLIPVSVPNQDMQPKHNLPGTADAPIALLAYPESAYFKRLVDAAIKSQTAVCYLEDRYINSFADAIRSMALEGSGLAWLPESMIVDDLATGRFVVVPGDNWVIDLDICIYRNLASSRTQVDLLWNYFVEKYK